MVALMPSMVGTLERSAVAYTRRCVSNGAAAVARPRTGGNSKAKEKAPDKPAP